MDLGDRREAAVREPLDEPDLPERAVAIERLGRDPRRQGLQLPAAAGLGQPRVVHVVGDVEALVVDPDRQALDGDEGEALAIARQQVQPRGDVVAHARDLERGVRAPARGRIEEGHGADIRLRAVVLDQHEGAVLGREAGISARRCGCARRRRLPPPPF